MALTDVDSWSKLQAEAASELVSMLFEVGVCCPEDRRLKAGSPIPVAGLEISLPDSLAA
jgi:hypothetical protein